MIILKDTKENSKIHLGFLRLLGTSLFEAYLQKKKKGKEKVESSI